MRWVWAGRVEVFGRLLGASFRVSLLSVRQWTWAAGTNWAGRRRRWRWRGRECGRLGVISTKYMCERVCERVCVSVHALCGHGMCVDHEHGYTG